MATLPRQPRDPAETRRRIALARAQRDRIVAAAAALEAHAGHDRDPLAVLLAAAELRAVAGQWDRASEARAADGAEQHLRDALRRIARAESGIWGWIARDALDAPAHTSNTNTGARGHATPASTGSAIAARRPGA